MKRIPITSLAGKRRERCKSEYEEARPRLPRGGEEEGGGGGAV
jgi:hypothetical protein